MTDEDYDRIVNADMAMIEDLRAQLEEAKALASQIVTDWIPANQRLARELEEAREATFAKITELIGEMSWGIDLPSPMTVMFQEFMGEPEKIYAVHPKNYEIVFDAIWKKLKQAPEYQPYITIQKRAEKAESEAEALRAEVERLKERLRYIHEECAENMAKSYAGLVLEDKR